jgi:predicted Rossmann-fold nucleotide-binding protein
MISVIQPTGALALISQIEAESLSKHSQGDLYDLYRNCSLAVLNSGVKTDNSQKLLNQYRDFEINVIKNERGLKLELINPPKTAFVDGEIISSIQNNLYSVLRDIVQLATVKNETEMLASISNDKNNISKIRTNQIFHMLRHAGALKSGQDPNVVVCWGGHAINDIEYEYAYQVGMQLGLRGMDICTGCGPGVMEAPMKGAIFGRAMQHCGEGRFIGLTEPSIIAAEPPNPMVSELIILHDIEKRLEAFVRVGNCILIFPGGPGTAEELLYLLTIKLTKSNRHEPIPLILTGPKESEDYFIALDNFVRKVLGEEVSRYYSIIIGDPEKVAKQVKENLILVKDHRTLNSDAYCFNWSVEVPCELQEPFIANHANMASLNLHRDQPVSMLAANLRRAFSGIVAGNVKESGLREIEKNGPFKLSGDKDIIEALDTLLRDFIKQGRILLSQEEYKPCYVLEAKE